MSTRVYQEHKARQDFTVLFPASKTQFKQTMKNLRSNLYILVDVVSDAVWMALGNKLVKVRFPNTEGM